MRSFMDPAYFYLHSSGRSWPTDDPHRWLLDHRDDALLASACERLVLSPNDPERCVRVALRRCSMALIHVANENRVLVRHWSGPAPDLREFAKQHRLARAGVAVTFESVKAGRVVVPEDGQDILLYGHRVGPNFPWDVYSERYERRRQDEADDNDAAPAAYTNFSWANASEGRLTWQVLKTVWNAERVGCPNCDVPILLVAFSWRTGMLSFRSAQIVRHCLRCRRRFAVAEERPLAWLESVLPPQLRPTHLMLWRSIPIDWPRMSLGHAQAVQLAGLGG